MSKILGLDISSTTVGWAIIDADKSGYNLVEHGHIKPPNSTKGSLTFRASKYYDDPTLDWIIFLVNDIVDPYYDWPLSDESFDSYMRTLYGSTAEAKSTVFEYRKIINNQSVRFDGKIIPKRTVVVDLNTYNSLPATDREQISAYDYYFEQNVEKRKIKILDKQFVSSLVREVDLIFSDLN